MAQFAYDFRDGVDINLGVGYVNERTIPVAYLSEALQAVAAGTVQYRQAFNYGSPAGSSNLLSSIRRFVGGRAAGKEIAIGACGATSILDALTEVLEPGIVVTSDPTYYIYTEALERKGFEVLAIPEDGEGIELEALERRLRTLGDRARRISFLYVVTVNNPSSTILSNSRRRALLDVATRLSREQGRVIPIFYDLAYELLLHDLDHAPFVSVLPEDESGIAYEIGTLSKVLAPALRIGYVLGPRGPLMKALVQKTSDAGFSAPVFVQEMASYLLDHHIAEQIRAVNAGYREKAVAVRHGIEQSLGPFLEACRGGSAGFYYYLTFKGVETHPKSAFFEFLARITGDPSVDGPPDGRFARVVYIPGDYCVHPRGELAELGKRQLRISYGFEDVPQILRALDLMREAAVFAREAAVLAANSGGTRQ
jgi:DNA-binding transcriptional MocR family regulator